MQDIKCIEVKKDALGNIIELHCTYDPRTKSGSGFSERKPKGTIHWVSGNYSETAEVRIYDMLFKEIPEKSRLIDCINPDSLIIRQAFIENSIKCFSESRFQFVRQGYFIKDSKNYTNEKPVYNLTAALKSSYKG